MTKPITRHRNLGTLSFTIIFILFASLLFLAGCDTITYTPPSTPSTHSSPATPTTPVPEQIQSPPLVVELDYFGIKSTHRGTEPVPPKIQLYVLVDDGKTKQISSFPPGNEGMVMEDFHLENLRGQGEVFCTSSVGDYLKISILAYSSEDKETKLEIWRAMEALQPGVSTLRQIYEQLPKKEVLIGYYDNTWHPEDNWGIGKYEAVGSGDLKLWFRIWSETETKAIAKPSFGPEVRILDVKLPSNVKKRSPDELVFVDTYPTKLILQNDEAVDVTVDVMIDGQGHCLDLIAFTGGEVTIPKYGHKEITTKYYYETADTRQITYTISYKGVELDTWQGKLSVAP